MKNFDSHIICLNSDAINRKGYLIQATALNKGALANCLTGLPSLLSHDFHHPLGWITPYALYFEPRLTRLLGTLYLPKTKLGEKIIDSKMRNYLNKIHISKFAEYENKFLSLIDKETCEHALSHKMECISLYKKDIALYYFANIFKKQDKDGLISLADLGEHTYLGYGVFKIGDATLYASNYFRKSYSRLNNTNYEFLDLLYSLYKKGVDVKLSFDPDLLGLAETFSHPMELEYWWGPKFSDDLRSIATGVTCHVASEVEALYHGISKTEFWWQSRDNLHIFEVEEMRDQNTFANHLADKNEEVIEYVYGCRYLHSIINENNGEVLHIDGSIRTYTEEKMIERLDSQISQAGRQTEYKKLWRLDYPITVSEWKLLVNHYFKNNHLVGEYLGANSNERNPEKFIDTEKINDEISSNISGSLDEGDGIRLCLSYHTSHVCSSEVEIIPLDTLQIDDETNKKWFDSFTFEIKKILERKSLDVSFPSDALVLEFTDLYMYLPSVYLRDNSEKLLGEISDTFKILIDWSSKNDHDRVFAFNFSYPISTDIDIRFSFLGHEKDLQVLFSSTCARFPRNINEVDKWIEKFNILNSSSFQKNRSKDYLDMVKESGIIVLKRKSLLPEVPFTSFFNEQTNNIDIRMAIPKNKAHILENINQGKLRPALMFIAKENECSICKKSYFKCPCSKILDNAVAKSIEHSLIDAFWTDRHEFKEMSIHAKLIITNDDNTD